MDGKKKQELLSDYYQSQSVLRWLRDNGDLSADKNIEQLSIWYAAGNSKDEATWLKAQVEKLEIDTKPPALKTRRGGIWDSRLKEILELFAAFDWEVVPYKTNKYVESWKVTDKDLCQAILYLTTNGFSMGSDKPDKPLTGSFEGYDDQERFNDFLVSNDIEIED